MSKSIKPKDLGDAIAQELTMYHKDVVENVNDCGRRAIERLVELTKATAPIGGRNGHFRKRITYTEKTTRLGAKEFIWHVKAPDHRLTHLLVHGHATKNGGRTKADPFLANALDRVLPDYAKEVEEACK